MLNWLHDGHNKRLIIGLDVGLGAGIPSVALLGWMGSVLHTIMQDFNIAKYVAQALSTFRMDMIPHFNFAPHRPGGSLGGEVAESVDQWAENLGRQGNTAEEAAEIMRDFEADMAAAEEVMPASAGAETMADFASGVAGSASEAANSWAVQAAAEIAASGSSSAEALSDALLKAGVPTEAVESTSEAALNAVNAAGRGWIGRPSFNAALNVISSAVTPAGTAAAEAAQMAVNGAAGAGLEASLAAAGVPATALEATTAAMGEAISAAVAAGTEPVVAAIGVVASAASPAGVAAATAMSGASSAAVAQALAAAGVAPGAIGATANAVAAAISDAGGSGSAALMAATNIIANAGSSVFKSGSFSFFGPPSSPSQAVLDVLGTSFNFWHIFPVVVWDAVTKLGETSDSEAVAKVLGYGPPPVLDTYRDITFPYLRGVNRIPYVPADGDLGDGKGPGGDDGDGGVISPKPSSKAPRPTFPSGPSSSMGSFPSNTASPSRPNSHPGPSSTSEPSSSLGPRPSIPTPVPQPSFSSRPAPSPSTSLSPTDGFSPAPSSTTWPGHRTSPALLPTDRAPSSTLLPSKTSQITLAPSETNSKSPPPSKTDGARPPTAPGKGPATPGSCTATDIDGTPESRKAENKLVLEAVKSFKHDRAKYLSYLKAHPETLARAKKAIHSATCKMQEDIDDDEVSGIAKTMAQALLQSLRIILEDLEGVKS